MIFRMNFCWTDAPFPCPFVSNIILPVQLKDTAERILAVDRAAAMVEEMLKLGSNAQPSLPIFPIAPGSGAKVCLALLDMCSIAVLLSENYLVKYISLKQIYVDCYNNKTISSLFL